LETFTVGQSPGRIFISYSRTDGAEYAAWLRTWLGQHDLSVWQDIVALEGGRDWWSQIEDALRSPTLQHFILVVTPRECSADFKSCAWEAARLPSKGKEASD
jgi:hypothetical protein